MKLIANLFLLSGFFLPAPVDAHTVAVNASYLNVRNSEGAILCVVPHDTEATAMQRHADGKRILVRFPHPPRGCPRQGLVSGWYLDVLDAEGDASERATVELQGLALRSAPRISKDTLKCSLDKGTMVKVTDEEFALSDRTPWIKVTLDPPRHGCPASGYVLQSYLNGVNPFLDLPVMKGTVEQDNASVAECCDRPAGAADRSSLEGFEEVSKSIGRRMPEGKPQRRARAPSKPPPSRGAEGQSSSWSASSLQRMVAAFHRAASKYRLYAPHVCRRLGRRYPCGGSSNLHFSKGWCKAGVDEALREAFHISMPRGDAINMKRFMDRTFTKLEDVRSCKEAPVGAVCVYDRRPVHNFGHIEGKTARNEYCSDFCTNHPIRVGRFLGAYMPGVK